MDLQEILDRVPQPALLAFASIGAFFAILKTLSYLQFMLNIFLLGGTNVRDHKLHSFRSLPRF